MNISKFKVKAQKSLKKNFIPLLIALIIIILLQEICSLIGFLTSSRIIHYGLTLIVDSLIVMGFISMISKASKNRKVKVSDLLSKTDLFLKYIGIMLFIAAIVIALGVLEAIAFKSLATVMNYPNEVNMVLSILFVAFGILLSVAILLVTLYILLSFSQVLFILNDKPKLSVGQVLSESFDMMEDYIADYFVLLLSFLGWVVLSIIMFVLCYMLFNPLGFIGSVLLGVVFGLLFSLLMTYMLITMSNFYEYIKKDYKKHSGDKEPEKLVSDKAQEDAKSDK